MGSLLVGQFGLFIWNAGCSCTHAQHVELRSERTGNNEIPGGDLTFWRAHTVLVSLPLMQMIIVLASALKAGVVGAGGIARCHLQATQLIGWDSGCYSKIKAPTPLTCQLPRRTGASITFSVFPFKLPSLSERCSVFKQKNCRLRCGGIIPSLRSVLSDVNELSHAELQTLKALPLQSSFSQTY